MRLVVINYGYHNISARAEDQMDVSIVIFAPNSLKKVYQIRHIA